MRRYLAITGLLLLLADLLAAQPAPTGRFWYGFGVGVSGMRMQCSICQDDVHIGSAAQLHAGWHASPRLRLGLEAAGWGEPSGDLRRRQGALGLTAQWRLAPGSRWLATGGAGMSWFELANDDASLTSAAPRLHAGLAWEWRLSPGWWLLPSAGLAWSFGNTFRMNGAEVVSGAGIGTVQAGIGLFMP